MVMILAFLNAMIPLGRSESTTRFIDIPFSGSLNSESGLFATN